MANFSYLEKRGGKETIRTEERRENDWTPVPWTKMLLLVLTANMDQPLSHSNVHREESPHPECVLAFCSGERLLQLYWEYQQPCFQTLPDFFLTTASTLPIKICRFPLGTKAALPPRDSQPCPALRPVLSQDFAVCLRGVNRNWKLACSPPKHTFF